MTMPRKELVHRTSQKLNDVQEIYCCHQNYGEMYHSVKLFYKKAIAAVTSGACPGGGGPRGLGPPPKK